MNISFSDIKLVAMAGYSSVWRIPPEDCIETPDGVFVRMKPFGNTGRTVAAHKGTLLSLVLEANENINMSEYAKSKSSLTLNSGYDFIMKQRNAYCVDDDPEPALPQASLFDTPANPKKRKKSKVAKQHRAEDRGDETPQQIAISIKVDDVLVDIDVLKASIPSAALYVKYDVDMISNVIKYMRDSLFAEPEPKQKLPAGIQQPQRLKGKFLVKATSPVGKVMWRCKLDISSAADWQAQVANGEACDEASDAGRDEHSDAGDDDACDNA